MHARTESDSRPVVICYDTTKLKLPDIDTYQKLKPGMTRTDVIRVPPRDAKTFKVSAGQFFRILCTEGPQVGDLNLWQADNMKEHFFSGKTRQIHASHLSTGDRLWSNLPHLRAIATITHDTLDWYGWDSDGAGVHDVIGTRCDPYTNFLLKGSNYNNCCHSNLIRALATELNITADKAEPFVHDVLNVFMCTGFTRDTHQYFMKASPVKPGDYLEFYAETDLLGALSACPGGDCGHSHSDNQTPCYPLDIEIFTPQVRLTPETVTHESAHYSGSHGL